MADDNPSVLSHVSLGTNQYTTARTFYEKVLSVLGCKIILEHSGAVAFGKTYPEFWLHQPFDGKPATAGNGAHVGFFAATKAEVDAFFAAAISAGASPDGEPGSRAHYGAPYYGCFVRDLDGNKIEATYWDVELATAAD